MKYQSIFHRALTLFRLLRSASAVVDSTLYTAEIRLCRYILAAAEGGCFRDVLTETAGSVGVSYRHLHRLLGKLCREDILEETNAGYRIQNRERLESLCRLTDDPPSPKNRKKGERTSSRLAGRRSAARRKTLFDTLSDCEKVRKSSNSRPSAYAGTIGCELR